MYAANNPVNRIDPTGLQAFTEYSELNENSEEEGAEVEPLGEGAADFYAEVAANNQIPEAQALYRGYFSPGDNVTIAKGQYVDLADNIHSFVGTNDFYGTRGQYLLDKITAPGGLQNSVSEFIPVRNFPTAGDALHVEFKVLNYVEEIAGSLARNSRVVVGISHPTGICAPCQYALLTESGYPVTQVGGTIIVTIENGIRIFIAGVP